MAKRNVLLATIVGICAAGQLMSMDERSKSFREFLISLNSDREVIAQYSKQAYKESKGSLSFLLDASRQITAYSGQNMDFFEEPSKFIGKDIVEAVPLNSEDRVNFLFGFTKAASENKKMKVPYTLDKKEFLAKITPLIKGQTHNFFVEVKEKRK